jgi:hypothetical protein
LTIHQITSIPEGTSSRSFVQNVGKFLTDALDPFQLRDQHLMMEVAADIKQGSVALEDATRIVMRAIDPVSDELRGWYSSSELKTVETCYTLVRQYEAAAVDREGGQLRETLERLGERLGAAGEEPTITEMPSLKLDLRGDLAMVAAELRDGPITKERAGDIVDQALQSFDAVGTLDKKHLEALAICLLATDDGDLNNIFSVEEPDTARYLRDLVRVEPIADLKEIMTDAGVDFLAVASRVAQGRFPLREQEISNLDVAVRERWLNGILDEIEDGREFNKYDTARLLLKAHALTDSRVPRTERYLNSIFTEAGGIRPEIREILGGSLEGEPLVDQAVMMMRLRGKVRLAAEHLSNVVTGYDNTLRTDGRMVQPGLIDLEGGHEIMMDQFAEFCDSDLGENLQTRAFLRSFQEAFEVDVDNMLGRFAVEFYNPTSAEFIAAFDQWRVDAGDSWEITEDQHVNLVSALLTDIGNGSGHPEALFDRYVAARDFIYQGTLAPSPEDQMNTKVSVRMLLLKELELSVVSGLIDASWTEERENLEQYFANRREKIVSGEDEGNIDSPNVMQFQSVEKGIQLFWNYFGNNTKNPSSGCILDKYELTEILFEKHTPLFIEDVHNILSRLNISLEPYYYDDEEED